MSTCDTFHSLTWIFWLIAAVVAASTTRNPLYLVLILLCLLLVFSVVRSRSALRFPIVSPFTFTLVVVALSSTLNALSTHYGQTVLWQFPAAIPIIGGKVTLEAIIYGFINGLVLSCIFTAFTVFNLVMPVRSFIRYIPRAFAPLATVASIAVGFVPVTLRQLQDIREAQAIRGHRLRGLRSWIPLFLPLLTNGLEHALQLAEAMAARGFARRREQVNIILIRAALVVGLVMLSSGLLLRVAWGEDFLGALLILIGGGLILALFWFVGRQVPRTTYRQERWSWNDTLALGGVGIVFLVFLVRNAELGRESLSYSPYPLCSLPPFDPLIGLAIFGLLGTLAAGRVRKHYP